MYFFIFANLEKLNMMVNFEGGAAWSVIGSFRCVIVTGKRNEGDWTSPWGNLQWEWLSPRSFFLSVPSASWQAQTSGMWGCSVLVCAGVWAPGPRPPPPPPPPPPLYIQLRVGRLAPHHNGVQYSAARWGDCCFWGTGTEEDSLPGAPARRGRPFLCEVLMATRWRARRGGGGVYTLSQIHSILSTFP